MFVRLNPRRGSLPFVALGLVALLTSACLSRPTSRARDVTTRALEKADTASEETRSSPVRAAVQDASTSSSEADGPDSTAIADACVDIADRIANSDPGARARRQAARAELERADAATSLPPPTLSLQVWDFPIGHPALANREGMYMVGVAQTFPAPGLANARARRQIESAGSELGDARMTRLSSWTAAMHACVDWASAQRAREVTRGQLDIIDRVGQAIAASRSTGASSLADEARLDAERASVEQELLAFTTSERVAARTLDALGGELSAGAKAPSLGAVPASPPLEKVLAIALERRGEIAKARARERVAEAEVDEAVVESSVPELGVQAAYMQTPKQRAGMELMVSATLPFLWSGGGGKRSAARREVGVAHAEEEASVRDIRASVTRAYETLEGQRRTLEGYRGRLVPAADRLVEAEQAGLTGGSFDLTALLRAVEQRGAVRITVVNEEAALQHAHVDLESAAGGPLRGAAR